MKLIQTLKLLPLSEYRAFEAFLKNDLFNKRKDLQLLFSELKNGNWPDLDFEKLYLQVYTDTAFNIKNWHLLCSRLLKVLEDYFAHRQLREYPAEKKMLLADYYRQKNASKKYQKATKEAAQALKKSGFRSRNYWLQKHRIEEIDYDYIKSQNRMDRTNLQEVSDSLDVFFIISKLKLGCRQLSRQVINAEAYDVAMIDMILAQIKQRPALLEFPAVAVYYYCYQAISISGTENDFQQLRSAINQHSNFFPAAELRDIYLIAINFCVRKINTGHSEFNKEAFELYRLSLQGGLLLEDGVFPESTYNNIVMLAINEQAFAWAKEFIDEYQWKLKRKFSTSMHSYCMGKILFAQGKYDDCLKALAQTSGSIPFIYLGSKTIQLKIFYENEAWDALDSLIETLRVYLQRRKDLGYRKTNYGNLINYTKRLLQLNAMSKSEKENFKQDIMAAEIFTEKEWFLDKI